MRAGKGGKWRAVPLTLTARRALEPWRASPWGNAAPGEGMLVFPGRDGAPALTARAVQQAFARYGQRAGTPDSSKQNRSWGHVHFFFFFFRPRLRFGASVLCGLGRCASPSHTGSSLDIVSP